VTHQTENRRTVLKNVAKTTSLFHQTPVQLRCTESIIVQIQIYFQYHIRIPLTVYTSYFVQENTFIIYTIWHLCISSSASTSLSWLLLNHHLMRNDKLNITVDW